MREQGPPGLGVSIGCTRTDRVDRERDSRVCFVVNLQINEGGVTVYSSILGKGVMIRLGVLIITGL